VKIDVEIASHDSHDLLLEDITNNDHDDNIILQRSRRHILDTAHTLKGFNVPKLEFDKEKTVEMITLPTRSVLKKKRKDLKIKVKNVSLVMNRKLDSTGSYYNILNDTIFDNSAEDIWKQFDDIDEEEELLKDDINIKNLNNRSGFAKSKTVIYIKLKVNSVLWFLCLPFKYCYRRIMSCMPKRREKKSEKIYDENFKNSENDDENEMKNDNENVQDIDNINKNTENPDDKRQSKTVLFEGDEEDDNVPTLTPEIIEDEGLLDLSLISFDKAFFHGYLNKEEYSIVLLWYGNMIFIALFGVTLGNTVSPQYLGYVIWFSLWLIITTFIPIIQYFNTYKVSIQMKQLIFFSVFLHVLFCVIFFIFELNINIRDKASVWILNYLVLCPLFLNILFNLLIWRDNNYKNKIIEKKIEKKTLKNKLKKKLKYLCQSYPYFLLIIVLFNVEFYVYISILGGEILTVLILLSVIGFLFLKNWTENDFYMNKSLIKLGSLFLNIAATVSFFGKLFSYFIYLSFFHLSICIYMCRYIYKNIACIERRAHIYMCIYVSICIYKCT
jgi:hypothetical protein